MHPSVHHQSKFKQLVASPERLLRKVSAIGLHAQQWAQAMLVARGIEGTRVLQGLISLTRKHAGDSLETACATALSYGAFRLWTIRQLLRRQAARQQPLPFLDEHPLIRPLDDYARLVTDILERTGVAAPHGFQGMAGQMNVCPENKTALAAATAKVCGTFTRPDPALPRRTTLRAVCEPAIPIVLRNPRGNERD